MGKLTKDQVRHVAKLADLLLTDEELEKYSEQLSRILEYIDQLNSIDTKDVEPTFNVSGLENVMRDDEAQIGLIQEQAIANAPKQKDGFIITKGVLEEE